MQKRGEPPYFNQAGMSMPPAPMNSAQMFAPSHFTPLAPTNGGWGQPQPPAPASRESWDWDENVNSYPEYQDSNPMGNISNPAPPLYAPADLHSVSAAPNPLAHMGNNNQYEQPSNSNQNWEQNWDDEWGWGNKAPRTNAPDTTSDQRSNQIQAMPNSFQGVQADASLGIESSMSTMSLTNQIKEDALQPEEPQPWSQTQQPPSTAPDDTASFSRVSTWGSAMDHGAEHGFANVAPEANFYHPELGERNTYADGASFTDASQPPPSAPSAPTYPVSNGPPLVASQPPPSFVRPNQLESFPLQQLQQPAPSSDVKLGETPTEPVHVEPSPVAYLIPPPPQPVVAAKISVPPMPSSYGHTDGFHDSPAVNHQYGIGDYQHQSQPQPNVPSNAINTARYPESVSRSQSGTPSMERESERPDAEGGYENDQPAAPYQLPPPATYVLPERKIAQESPAGSRPSSRQEVITPSSETPMAIPPSYQVQSDVGSFARPKTLPPTTGFFAPVNPTMAPPQVLPVPAAPPVARGSQEAVGSENGPPTSRADGSNVAPTMFPPSSQRMIPGSGSQGPIQQTASQQQQPRPAGSITPVAEQRIVTGFAKNDPVPNPPVVPAQTPIVPVATPVPVSHQPLEEARSHSGTRSPPPPHRSETIGSENPRGSMAPVTSMPVGNVGVGTASGDRSDDRISLDRQPERDRHDRDVRNHDRMGDRREDQSRMDRERDRERERDRDRDRERDRNRDDYERDRNRDEYNQSRYEDDDDERYSMTYRDRRFDHERDGRRYGDRDRGYSRDYDDDRRSGYGPADRDRLRDPRRRESRRSDYYLTEAEMYERSGGRRSSLYEGDNSDPAGDYNRSAYGFNTSRDGRRRDTDRSRIEDPYYPGQRDRPVTEMSERPVSERDYRMGQPSRRRDPRDVYYQDPRMYYGYGRSTAYDTYPGGYGPWAPSHYNQMRQYFQELTNAYKRNNYAYLEELRMKNPSAYTEWYQRYFASQRYPSSITTGPGTGVGSIATSEADRASVHSGRSSVADDHPSMLANHSLQQAIRGSTTGLDQTNPYADFSTYQDNDPGLSIIAPVQDTTPLKFPYAHTLARFSGNGFLLRVLPNNPKEGVPALVELHEINALLSKLPESQETRLFPGPLVAGQSHKQEVTVFCQQKIRQAMDDTVQLVDRQSYILLWEFLLLLLRQNGTVVGTDIAELLLKDHEVLREPVVEESHEHADAGTVVANRTLVSRPSEATVVRKFTELLLFGHKTQALELAMTNGLWGHALFLAMKMDQRTFSGVIMRFANGLAINDPLQTLYQLLSGRQPAAVTSCGDDKYGDWRPHLAMILSNPTTKSSNSTDLDRKSVIALGDTLASRGYLYAAQFCYLVAQVEFGTYSNKASKLVLLTSSTSSSFEAFATNEAIQCTEVYEYARQLASPDFVIPSFQPYKFLYATRLAEIGRSVEALQYCEAIGNVMSRSPSLYPVSLMSQVCQMGSMLRYSDPQYLTESDGSPVEDPAWITSLGSVIAGYAGTPAVEDVEPLGQTQPQESESQPPMDLPQEQRGEAQLQQPYLQQPYTSSSQDQQTSFYNPTAGMMQQQSRQHGEESMMSQNTNDQDNSISYAQNSTQDYGSYTQSQYNSFNSWQQPVQQQQQQQPQHQQQPHHQQHQQHQQQSPWGYNETPATNGSPYWGQQSNDLGSVSNEENGVMNSLSNDYYSTSSQNAKQDTTETEDSRSSSAEKKKAEEVAKKSGGWFGSWFKRSENRPTPMKLPDDSNPSIQWDPIKKQWVNKDEDNEKPNNPLPPPPSALSFQSLPSMPQSMPVTGPGSSGPSSLGAPPSNAPNMFGLKAAGVKRGYASVNSFAISKVTATLPVAPAPAAMAMPQLFVPSPVDQSAPSDFSAAPDGNPMTSQPAQPQQQPDTNRLLFDPSQMPPPAAPPARTGLAPRGRYPR